MFFAELPEVIELPEAKRKRWKALTESSPGSSSATFQRYYKVSALSRLGRELFQTGIAKIPKTTEPLVWAEGH
eukprot:7482245-Alexandrium_andersonii.AAC.1